MVKGRDLHVFLPCQHAGGLLVATVGGTPVSFGEPFPLWWTTAHPGGSDPGQFRPAGLISFAQRRHDDDLEPTVLAYARSDAMARRVVLALQRSYRITQAHAPRPAAGMTTG